MTDRMDLTIVIPTYNERDGVRALVDRIRAVLARENCRYEILFVDDSSDDTPQVLEQLTRLYPEVRYIHRSDERGLATAVAMGFKAARGRSLIVMDADLQHPPELIPLIAARLKTADVVIPSRFIAGGSDGGLDWCRKLISWTARTIGRVALKRVRGISDCTGGYFGLRRGVLRGVQLDPVGWKILLEVLVKGRYRTVHEVPYAFAPRDSGQSKMSLKEQWNYLRHIARLVRSSPEDRRFLSFCLVGTLGVGVNLLSLSALLNLFAIDKLAGSVGASLIAMVHNFLWNDRYTWRTQQQAAPWQRLQQFLQFALICGLGIAITALVARAFLSLGISIYIGQLAGIMVATYWSFTANDRWTWSYADQHKKAGRLVVTQECASEPLLAVKPAWRLLGHKRGVK
jgi:dolichol-phosphate mannosyltransferase